MKTCPLRPVLLPMLLASLGLMLTGRAPAQTLTVLHTFNGGDGGSPNGVVLSSNTLYATGLNGGANGNGTVFKINTDGTEFTNLYMFSAGSYNNKGLLTNSDGENPGNLLLSGNTLYGTTTKCGTNGSGTVFRVNTDGTGFTNLYNFSTLTANTNRDGASPDGGELTISNNTLYGTALLGGANGKGTVFKINTDGTGFTNLYTFSAGTGSGLDIVNNDGALPNGTLTLSGNTLYGTTSSGGNGAGVLFKVNTDGSGFTNFYSFGGYFDGSLPVGFLLLSGNTLYGATMNGGTNNTGTVFAINTNGTGFINLYTFSAGNGTAPYITNSDGAKPSLAILTNNTLYGRAGFGTSSGDGSVFKINIDGTGFTNLHNFTGSDGADPGSVVLSGNTLYGSASRGGTNGDGTVFSLSLPLAVITTSLPDGTYGIAYSQTLSAFGGQAPYTWTNSSGTLPPGLTLATNGVISGTPTTNGTFNFTVKVTDTTNNVATQALMLTVGYPPGVTIQPTNNSVEITAGNNMAFVALVGGTGPFSYQWQLNGTNLPNGIISTVAGNGYGAGTETTGGYSGDGGAATNAELFFPAGVTVDATGNLFIVDFQNNVIRKVDNNGIITTVAGNGYGAGTGTGGYSGDGGAATNAELYFPQGVAVDATGNLFIADYYNNVIRKVGTNGIITTVTGNGYGAGTGSGGYSGDGGTATNAELNQPTGVAVDTIGNLFIADLRNNVIRKVGTNGIITTVAGNGYGAGMGFAGYTGDGGAATNAELNLPQAVAVDADGNLFIADFQNNVIREVDNNGIITTVAGNGYGAGTGTTGGYSGDGAAATNAELYGPVGVAVDTIGNLFIADVYNNVIRKVVIQGQTLVLGDVNAGKAGAYDVVVSSPYGSVTSSVVNLSITLPVVFSAPKIIAGSTNFTFLFTGPAGSNYVLQVSTNLVNWSSVITSTVPISGSITLTNAIGNYKNGFYRVYLQ